MKSIQAEMESQKLQLIFNKTIFCEGCVHVRNLPMGVTARKEFKLFKLNYGQI